MAGAHAAPRVGAWRERILRRLAAQPSTLFEVATHYGVPDHTISGRFTELARDLYIERTGERRPKPESACLADVWRVRGAAGRPADLAEMMGYPLTFLIDGEPYDRQELLPNEGYPGIPYARRADTGGLRVLVRVAMIECEGCGRPLKLVIDNGRKKFRCGTPGCDRTFEMLVIQEPGQPQIPALVMRTY